MPVLEFPDLRFLHPRSSVFICGSVLASGAMKAASFSYFRASSVAEACDWLRRDGDEIKLIAGGQSLVPMMAMRLTRPQRLVDINEIPALKFIAIEEDCARTGAG